MATGVNDKALVQMLNDCGVPNAAISTTLPKEGQNELREFVEKRRYREGGTYRGVYVYNLRPAEAVKARRVFLTAAKEMLLSGAACYVLSLSRLVEAINNEEEDNDWHRINEADIVFVTDFYEHGCNSPMDSWQATRVRHWVKDKIEEGKGVSLLADVRPMGAAWWPPSFLAFIQSHVVEFEVK